MKAARLRLGLTLGLLASLLACNGETPTPPAPADLVVGVTNLSFAGVEGGQATPQTLVVTSSDEALQWTASSSEPWVTLTPASGTTPTPIVATASLQGLAPGSYTGAITVTASAADNSPRIIQVTLSVAAAPRLALSPTALSFAATTVQPQATSSAVQITNSGSGSALNWSAATSAAWITLSPTSGTTPGTLTVGANGTGLAAGNYAGSVTITSAGALNSPQTLPVTLALTAVSYTVAVAAAPGAGGAVSGGGSYTFGSSATVTATPSSGYTFSNWTDGGTVVSSNPSYTFTVAGNRTLVANFAAVPASYTISTFPNPSAGGSTFGDGSYASGASVTVRATATAGYAFVSWTEGGSVVSTSPNYTFTASADRTLFANFSGGSPTTYTISTSSSPSAGGTTSGAGSYTSGATVTVTATPASGYAFGNWMEGGTVVSTSAIYTFTASANRTLVANFSSGSTSYSISTSSNPPAGGMTSGGGSYASGASVTVSATPASGFTFSNWTEGATVASTNASYTFTASANRTLVANFSSSTPTSYTIATSSNPAAGGATSGGGTYPSGASVTVTATASSGYTFSNWTEGATVVSSSASYTFIASANRTLTANFANAPGNYTISTSSNPSAGGTTSGGGSFAAGASVTVSAVPNSGFAFANWAEGGSVVSSSASYTFTASANRTLVANFSANGQFTISTSSNPANGGTTSGAGSYAAGASVTVRAVPSGTYRFSNWTEGGSVVASTTDYTFTATANRSLVANFDAAPTLTVSSPEDLEVARPSITLTVRCADDDPGGCVRVWATTKNGDTLAVGTSELNTTVSLARYEGTALLLEIGGRDGHTVTRVQRGIYVESSQSLEDVGNGGGAILDYQGGRLLYQASPRVSPRIAIRNAASGSDDVIPIPSAGDQIDKAYLTPGGAILAMDPPPYTLYDWRNGFLSSRTNLQSTSSLRVAGNYALFGIINPSDNPWATLYRRDLITGTDLMIATSVGNTDNHLAENGDVAYWRKDYAVYRYRNGATTKLTNDSTLWNMWPMTDGMNVVYLKSTPFSASQQFELVLHDGTSESVLSPWSTYSPAPTNGFGGGYDVRGGWTAFSRTLADGSRQIWTRSPSGVFQSVSPAGSFIFVVAVGDDGSVVYTVSGGRLYLVQPGGSPRDIGSGFSTIGREPSLSPPQVVWRDGSFYELLGRRAFRIH